MKSSIAATLITLLALTAPVAAHASEDDQSDRRTQFNGAKLNGTKFNGPGIVLQGRTMNGIGFNGPGVVLQGRTMNGIGFNGPGIVLQGNRFSGFATAGFNASETELDLVSVENCAAPPPAREWPLSALTASSVNVRLAPR